MGELFDIVSAKRVLQSDWQRTGIPFYRAREIVRLSYEGYVDNDLFITEEHYNNLKKSYGVPEPSDIMLSAVGTIGRAYVVRNNDVFYYKDASVLCLRNVYHLNSEFIKWILSSDLLQNQMYENSKGTTVDTITIEKANSYFLPLPPIDEQYRIVKLLCEWDAYINDINKNKEEVLNNIRTCKSKILDLAISGKLVPQDPNDEPAIELLKRINPAFKPCDNSHYENLPECWKEIAMGEICKLYDGEKVSGPSLTYIDVKYLRGSKVGEFVTSGKYVQQGNTLILVDGENSGEVFTTPIDGYQGSTFKILSITEYFDKEYVLLLIKRSQKLLRENKVGSAIPHLNKKMFKELIVPVPPLAEQKRIVATVNMLFYQLDMITAEL